MNNIDYDNYYPLDGKIIHSYGKRKDIFSDIESLTPYQGDENFVMPMFSVPLCHIRVKDWGKKKQQLLNLRKNTEVNQEDNDENYFDVTTDYHFNNRNGSTYSIDIHRILQDDIQLLEEMLLQETSFNNMVYPYSENYQYFFKLENSWFEKATKAKQHSAHTHGPVGYSCVLFIDYDHNEHSPTVFMNPFFSSFFGCPPDYQADHIVREGSLICFPAPVVHYTLPNNSDKDRVILSWNMCVVDQTNHRVLA
jgi:hypothetical protein